MLNVIVPLAGMGMRFLRDGYMRPKPFIKAWGKELILWLLEGLTLQSEDTLVLVFNNKPEVGMSASFFFTIVEDYFARLPSHITPEVKFVCVDRPTFGAAETVLRGIEALSFDRLNVPSVLLDGDTFYIADVLEIYRGMVRDLDVTKSAHASGGGVAVFDDDGPNGSPYSYVKIEHHSGLITRIKEKNKQGMSPLACSGCYCFHHTKTLMTEIQSALKLYLQNMNTLEDQSELYTSSIIAKMLENGGEFQPIKLKATDFKVLGTPEQLKAFIALGDISKSKKRFCFDLDNTLVTCPTVPGDYTTCKPISRVIDYVKRLHADGHYIIIHTARRMRTHRGNIGRVTADVGAITIQQLQDYAVPYDELIFGKPFADFYIDDKAILPFVDELHKETGIMA
jgi:capsule biosynthesis phosphatase